MSANRQWRGRGLAAERELARKLWKYGLAVIRAPASGAGTKHLFYPDLVAIYRGKVAIIEVKTRSKPSTIRIEPVRLEKLAEFAQRANADIFLAVKIVGQGWRIVKVQLEGEELRKGLSLPWEKVLHGLTLEQFIRLMKAGKTLTTA